MLKAPAPTPPDPGSNPRSQPSSAGVFVEEVLDMACNKLVDCSVVPGISKPACRSLLEDYGGFDIDTRVQSGDCSFNPRAANECLRLIGDLKCSQLSADVKDLTALVAGPLITCEKTLNCR